MRSIRKRLTYANVISSLCLFLLLGGGAAFAATNLSKNSVGRNQLKQGSVTSAKIAKNAVTAAKIKSNAVTGSKLASGSVTASKLAPSAIGNSALGDGSVSAAKLGNGSVVASKLGRLTEAVVTATVVAGERGQLEAKCPNGATLVSGGGGWGNLSGNKEVAEKVRLTNSTPIQTGGVVSGWSVEGFNGTATTQELFARAICLPS
ncbi:MAG TPA: hypothetical protein VIE64_07175 [Solirubrobacterales bacterium]